MALAAAVVVLLLSSCAAPRLPRAEDYVRSCTADGDCAVVALGLPCAVCAACPDAAIKTASVTEATADYLAAWEQCAPKSQVSCGPCPTPSGAVCSGGTCALST